MGVIFGKATKVFVAIFSPLIQVANLFIGNIIVYEATTGIRFIWINLLKNLLFWIVLGVTVAYYVIALFIKQREHEVDEDLEKAISQSSVQLIDIATQRIRDGDFESSKKILKSLDWIQKRRQR